MGCWRGCSDAFRRMFENMRDQIRPIFRRRKKNRVGVAPEEGDAVGPFGRKISAISTALNAEVPRNVRYVDDGEIAGPSHVTTEVTSQEVELEQELDVLATDMVDRAIKTAHNSLLKIEMEEEGLEDFADDFISYEMKKISSCAIAMAEGPILELPESDWIYRTAPRFPEF